MRDVSKFGRDTTTREVLEGIDLSGNVALITGGSSGLGQETARAVPEKGAQVILTARDVPKGEAVAPGSADRPATRRSRLRSSSSGSLASIRAFARRFLDRHPTLHILVNNAGVMASPFAKTEDGFEMQFGTNHLGHFLMTCLLAPALRKGAPSRIVSVSSRGHQLSPVVFDNVSVEAGAVTSVFAASAPELEGHGGLYLEDCHVAAVNDAPDALEGVKSYALDAESAERLWTLSEKAG